VSSKVAAARLKQLVKLSERKDALLAELQDIDRRMVHLEQEFRRSRPQKPGKGRVTFSTESKRPVKRTK
jgi:flagellar biosynthesis/type III secretory pathway chaperone